MSNTKIDATLAGELGQDSDSPFLLGLLLRQAHEQVLGSMDVALKPLGIERRHLVVLMRLAKDGSMPQRDLVSRTHHDKATIVRIVDDLEGKGLVTREPVPGDRRLWAVTMTDQGTRVYERARTEAIPAAADATSALTPEQVDQLRDLLLTLLRG